VDDQPSGQDADSAADRIRAAAVVLQALAQDGIAYAQNDYDLDRYAKIGAVAVDVLSALAGVSPAALRLQIGEDVGYATPKVDVRGVLFDADERVLLMRERSDGRWSPPGGWADPMDTPSLAVVREIREESGYPAEVVSLVGCWDRDAQGHQPPLPYAVFKLFFLCRVTGEPAEPDALETLDVGWFSLDALPGLSAGRVLERQLRVCLDHHRDPSLPTSLD
jgi:ADP-ribose pyrophosphatase YjhB (NUDIX family)